jgi:hypothetical protein
MLRLILSVLIASFASAPVWAAEGRLYHCTTEDVMELGNDALTNELLCRLRRQLFRPRAAINLANDALCQLRVHPTYTAGEQRKITRIEGLGSNNA